MILCCFRLSKQFRGSLLNQSVAQQEKQPSINFARCRLWSKAKTHLHYHPLFYKLSLTIVFTKQSNIKHIQHKQATTSMNGSNNNQHGGGLQQPPIAIPSGASLADYSRNGDPSSVLSQRQQQQNSSSINNLANNELLSLALSGDLSKALQAANLSLPQQHQQQVGANNALPGSIMQQLQTLLNMASGSGSQQAPTPQDNVQTNSRNPDPSVASLNSPSMHNSVTSGSSGSEPKPRNLTPDIVPCRARGMPSDHNFQVRSF